jgi:hypothetical protein
MHVPLVGKGDLAQLMFLNNQLIFRLKKLSLGIMNQNQKHRLPTVV